ncbi:hypothetical protein [Hasllibacter sp. MH4015]|uniref:hypothetical protein n=1 Tax=Hasllibacter sp. MH4015 TaxID=2854029 RepID=UPI001CD26880|nr:hypothetical protein [Hasllibacter sp. MH4015]
MTTGATIRFILEVLVFIAWAFMAYSVWSKLRRRDADQAHGFSAQLRHWWSNDADRQERNTLVWLTLVLLAMLAINIAL